MLYLWLAIGFVITVVLLFIPYLVLISNNSSVRTEKHIHVIPETGGGDHWHTPNVMAGIISVVSAQGICFILSIVFGLLYGVAV